MRFFSSTKKQSEYLSALNPAQQNTWQPWQRFTGCLNGACPECDKAWASLEDLGRTRIVEDCREVYCYANNPRLDVQSWDSECSNEKAQREKQEAERRAANPAPDSKPVDLTPFLCSDFKEGRHCQACMDALETWRRQNVLIKTGILKRAWALDPRRAAPHVPIMSPHELWGCKEKLEAASERSRQRDAERLKDWQDYEARRESRSDLPPAGAPV